ncbi:MAG: FCD domain-containing protein, partial [Microbacterium sp.]
VRRALEETAARLAAGRAAGDPSAAEAFAALADAFARTHPDADADAYYALIARFDAELDASVSNDYLTAALRTVRTHLVRVRRLARDHPQRLAASVSEHRLIASAIAAGDVDLAAHATHVHLHNALEGVLASLEQHHHHQGAA